MTVPVVQQLLNDHNHSCSATPTCKQDDKFQQISLQTQVDTIGAGLFGHALVGSCVDLLMEWVLETLRPILEVMINQTVPTNKAHTMPACA